MNRNFNPTSQFIPTSQNYSYNLSNNSNNIYKIIFFVGLVVVLYFIYNYERTLEGMAPGIIDQMYAKDQQDMAFTGGIDNIATGKFNLFYNQPTLIANTNNNRGQLYPSPQFNRDGVSTNLNNYSNMIKLQNDVANINNDNTANNYNNINEINKLSNKTEYLNKLNGTEQGNTGFDPASNGSGPGGRWLNKDIVNPIYDGPEYLNLNGNIIYPDSYLANPHYSPIPDVAYPLPIMGNVV